LVIGERRAYVAGLDLGQKRDYSAISLLEVAERTLEQRDPVTWERVRIPGHADQRSGVMVIKVPG
jgi:hypothetical protein